MLNESSGNRGTGKVPSIRKRAPSSTMNRPDSTSLNADATATAAAQAFLRAQSEEKTYKPAIATGFIPPVVDDKGIPDKPAVSPFKAAPKAPIKRTKGVTNAAEKDEQNEEKASAPAAPAGPQIAQFIPIPVIEEPKSPFAPLEKKESGPHKRPLSASINHAQVQNDQEDAEASVEESTESEPAASVQPFKPVRSTPSSRPMVAARPTSATPTKSAFGKKSAFAPQNPAPAAPRKDPGVRTSDKTFVPLAPVPYFAEKKEEINPFAAPVQKTEEQIKKEEEAARRALEESRSVEKKKSKLDKIMDELNRPIF
ncbi:MAG: hypothetical protein J6L84_05090 [Clostridiales bacterium]|nr:hypothetical protein [Clostridiales bacterium]MBP3811215.1 hypothetical protein [Clostridiales bacterium]